MLSGMVQAYNVLGEAEALQAVRDTITFLQGHMLRDGRLLSVYKDGQAKLNGYLDDYAFLAAALLDAFEATFTPAYFDLAQQLINTMIEEFWDEEHWGFSSLARVTKRLSSARNRCMTRLFPQAQRWPLRRSCVCIITPAKPTTCNGLNRFCILYGSIWSSSLLVLAAC